MVYISQDILFAMKIIIGFSFLLLFLTTPESFSSLIPSLTASEWMEGILTPLGPPSTQKMDCIASDNPMDKFGEIFQVLFKRTWPNNLVSLHKLKPYGRNLLGI